jgi:zinc and cadmium transporter
VSELTSLLVGSALMALLALVGGITLLLPRRLLQRLLLPLVALAAGSLLGGSLFHMIPEGFSALPPRRAGGWVAAGFSASWPLSNCCNGTTPIAMAAASP